MTPLEDIKPLNYVIIIRIHSLRMVTKVGPVRGHYYYYIILLLYYIINTLFMWEMSSLQNQETKYKWFHANKFKTIWNVKLQVKQIQPKIT